MKSFLAIPPGEILQDELDAREWTQSDLADIIGRQVQVINDIIRAKRPITPDIAIQLGSALGSTAESWINLEVQYQLAMAATKDQKKSKDIARRSFLYEVAPVRELITRKHIKKTKTIDELEKDICRFYGVKKPDEISTAINCSFRRSESDNILQPSLCAWVQIIKNRASKIKVKAFNADLLKSKLTELVSLSVHEDNLPKIQPILASLGIKLVYEKHLKQTRVDGVMFWEENTPVIGMSLRMNRIDNYWFTLLHEIGHILHDGQSEEVYIDEDIIGSNKEDPKDQKADLFARKTLIADESFNTFIKNVKPFFSRSKVVKFAEKIGIHPGIVVGRLHYEEHIPYSNLRRLFGKVREYVG
jgi:HTH-type transcriptional regulator/antitoxin HigA